MKLRSTLNGLAPRTLRDACRDPWDWYEASQRPDTPAEQVAGFVLVLIISVIGAASLVHWWTS